METNENIEYVPSSENIAMAIKDSQKRDVIVLTKDGEVALARYPDFTEKEIETILDMYLTLCDDPQEVERMGKFLRYDDDDDEFCS